VNIVLLVLRSLQRTVVGPLILTMEERDKLCDPCRAKIESNCISSGASIVLIEMRVM